ncbi:MAG TPA: SAM-dependent methyltransferase [Pyrinomonadaceae bacterium]|nr:SAM-dependent methyltransferase [Pyrinomonadaceae bacterium]
MARDDAETFFGALEESLSAGSFVKLTLAKHRGAEADLKNIYVRRVGIKRGDSLSFLYRHKTKDVVKNYALADGARLVRELLGAEFLGGHLFTSGEDLQIDFKRKGESHLVKRPPTFKDAATAGHDRKKRRSIETAGNQYLQALGVTDERGEVRPAMGDKLRQINRFVEIVAGLYSSSTLKDREEISVVDMGAGKGYLTFAVYDYFNKRLGVRAAVTGVESRAGLVELCNDTARRVGFDRLRFETGFIEEFDLHTTDILIALHACDTATDDAIFKGVVAGASIIITAPCCHKELRPQMRTPAELRGVLRHGLLLEREAESVTDSLRALLLERAGYRVKVFEFVSTEHTRKNTMIAAVRREDGAGRNEALRQFEALKGFYGIGRQRLECLLADGGILDG